MYCWRFRPLHTWPGTLENGDFFSEYGYHPHVPGVFGHRKRRFLNTLSRVKSFENGDSSYSCGRGKTEVSKYDDIITRFVARSSPHTIRKRCEWTQIFLNTKKTLRFRKYPTTGGRSNTIQKCYEWLQGFFFKYGGKKSPFSKIPDYVWTRPQISPVFNT